MAIPPWGDRRASISGQAFEHLVTDLLEEVGQELPGFRIEQQERIIGTDGHYRIDITIRFTQLGVDFLVLVECKEHARPVEREMVQVLADKVRSSGAQKGILFSTNGFQRGAIEYAGLHGIALVRVVDGALTYEVRGAGAGPPIPPPWANIPEHVGQLISATSTGSVCTSVVEAGRVEPLRQFLQSA